MCSVILNEVKNLINSGKYKCEILRLTPQNDVIGQTLNPPLEKEDEEKVLPFFKGEGLGGVYVTIQKVFIKNLLK